MQRLVVVDGEYGASFRWLDAGDRILEIKCPLKGRQSALWRAVADRRLPEHYHWQVEHQLMVTKAEVADVFVCDGQEGVMLETMPDTSNWPRIHDAWDAFAGNHDSNLPSLQKAIDLTTAFFSRNVVAVSCG